ncbi:MAG: hypothetical protein ACPG8W_03125 [Candidatus Promineifilaceae bacterium]
MIDRNVLITGIPRSGTTLTCYLLNQIPNVIALPEPLRPYDTIKEYGAERIADAVESCLQQNRKSLLTEGTAVCKHIDGKLHDNPFGNYGVLARYLPARIRSRLNFGSLLQRIPTSLLRGGTRARINFGLRPNQQVKGLVKFNKPLHHDFLLCLKQNELLTFSLNQLVTRFRCYAIIRNPLAVLASWNSVNFSLKNARSHVSQHLKLPIVKQLEAIPNVYDRQIHILDKMYQQYYDFVDEQNIIRYEEIISSNGQVLQKIAPEALELNATLASKNQNKLYDPKLMKHLLGKLLNYDGAFWHYYARDSVRQLVKNNIDFGKSK